MGSTCKFAHGSQDLGQPSNYKAKTQLCSRYSATGSCQYGDNCSFAHGEAELRQYSSPNIAQHPSYKTKMCKAFIHGTCTAGPTCFYAHGMRELRNLFRPGMMPAAMNHQQA